MLFPIPLLRCAGPVAALIAVLAVCCSAEALNHRRKAGGVADMDGGFRFVLAVAILGNVEIQMLLVQPNEVRQAWISS